MFVFVVYLLYGLAMFGIMMWGFSLMVVTRKHLWILATMWAAMVPVVLLIPIEYILIHVMLMFSLLITNIVVVLRKSHNDRMDKIHFN